MAGNATRQGCQKVAGGRAERDPRMRQQMSSTPERGARNIRLRCLPVGTETASPAPPIIHHAIHQRARAHPCLNSYQSSFVIGGARPVPWSWRRSSSRWSNGRRPSRLDGFRRRIAAIARLSHFGSVATHRQPRRQSNSIKPADSVRISPRPARAGAAVRLAPEAQRPPSLSRRAVRVPDCDFRD